MIAQQSADHSAANDPVDKSVSRAAVDSVAGRKDIS